MLYKIFAILWAVAVIAFAGPTRAFILLRNDPSDVSLLLKVLAAIRNASATRFLEYLVFPPSRFPPEILVPGQSPSHEANLLAVGHLSSEVPISETILKIVVALIPGISARSTPRI